MCEAGGTSEFLLLLLLSLPYAFLCFCKKTRENFKIVLFSFLYCIDKRTYRCQEEGHTARLQRAGQVKENKEERRKQTGKKIHAVASVDEAPTFTSLFSCCSCCPDALANAETGAAGRGTDKRRGGSGGSGDNSCLACA